jgi:hypothetical protein
MSRLDELVAAAHQGRTQMERIYDPFPLSIARLCGAAEVSEIVARLDRLAAFKETVEDWDGDAQDDVWRDQRALAALLTHLLPRFPVEVAATLQSSQPSTRFWGAWAMTERPTRGLRNALAAALSSESHPLNKEMIGKALQASPE